MRGLDGTLRIEVLTDSPDRRFVSGARLAVERSNLGLTVLDVAPGSPGLFVRFAEVQNRMAGERLVGDYLTIPVEQAQTSEDRVRWDEVVGVTVTDAEGELVGEIVDLYRAGGAEVYLVRTPDGGELDLPAVASLIVEFSPRDGRIVVDLRGSEITRRPPKRVRRRGPKKTPGSIASVKSARSTRRGGRAGASSHGGAT